VGSRAVHDAVTMEVQPGERRARTELALARRAGDAARFAARGAVGIATDDRAGTHAGDGGADRGGHASCARATRGETPLRRVIECQLDPLWSDVAPASRVLEKTLLLRRPSIRAMGRGADARLLGAAVTAPPLNEIVQLSLAPRRAPAAFADDAPRTDPRAKTAKARLRDLATSEPGMGVADRNALERCANVLTSAPFFLCGRDVLRRAAAEKQRRIELDWRDRGLGLHTTRVHDSLPPMNHEKMRRLGWALVGVGVAAAAYHLAPRSKRALRTTLRRVDYTAIALASMAASDAYGDAVGALPSHRVRLPRVVTENVTIATAAKFPLLVSAAHCALSEAAFYRGARSGRRAGGVQVERAWREHVAYAAAAGFFFVAEEVWPDFPLLHAAWHVTGAAAMRTGTTCAFGEHVPASPG